MCPEQAAGDLDRLGPRSDVYSLGATLYCLLTGRAPFTGDDVGTVLRNVQEGTFPPPRALDTSIDRALEAVCLKAMALRPEDRYASPKALADDVERWAADEPVSAYREPWTLLVSRWGRRNRILVTGMAAALAVAVVSISAGAVLIARERDRAVANLNESRRVVGAMFAKVVPRLADQKEMDQTQREILESALRFYTDFVMTQSRDPDVLHEVGRAYQQVADIHKKLEHEQAAETAFRQAVSVLDSLAAEQPSRPEFRRTLALTLDGLGGFYDLAGRPKEAEAAYLRSMGLREVLAAPAGADASLRAELVGHSRWAWP
jgi:serine/threonine-protein kinase